MKCAANRQVLLSYPKLPTGRPKGFVCPPLKPPGPRRGKGDAPYRCLWCDHWRIGRPLVVCEMCLVEYRAMMETMPSSSEEDNDEYYEAPPALEAKEVVA
jgi:hypothetical protein